MNIADLTITSSEKISAFDIATGNLKFVLGGSKNTTIANFQEKPEHITFENKKFTPKMTRRRMSYNEIESRILRMHFSNSGSRYLKQNVAFACFALIQSPFKINPEFIAHDFRNNIILRFDNEGGKTYAMRITDNPRAGILIYNQICDVLGLDQESGICKMLM